MNPSTMEAILRMSVEDRIRLVQAIWDSIAAESEPTSLTVAQKAEVRRRIEEYRRDPSCGIPAEEVFRELRKRHG